jgi:hypothetical protein
VRDNSGRGKRGNGERRRRTSEEGQYVELRIVKREKHAERERERG